MGRKLRKFGKRERDFGKGKGGAGFGGGRLDFTVIQEPRGIEFGGGNLGNGGGTSERRRGTPEKRRRDSVDKLPRKVRKFASNKDFIQNAQ